MTPHGRVVLLVLGMCVAIVHPMYSQPPGTPAPALLEWQLAAGPIAGNAKALADAESGTLFAYINAEIYRSHDDGLSWTRCESQPANRAGDLVFERWFLVSGRRLYASSASGGPLYVTDDECASSRPIPKPPGADLKSGAVTVVDGVLLAVYDGPALFTSSDEGRTWQQGQSPLADGVEPRLTTRNGSVFLVLSQQLYRSNDRGRTWSRLAANGPQFHGVVSGGDALYATASGGIWRSTDDGTSWTRVIESALTAVAARGPRVYASVFNPGATVQSVDDGKTWTRAQPPLPLHTANALLETRRGAVLAATNAGIYRSTDRAASWTAVGVLGQPVHSLVAVRGRAYASGADASLWTSVNEGLTWSRVEWSRVDNPRRFDTPVPFTSLFVVNGTELRGATAREFLASRDNGVTWSAAGLSKGVNVLVRMGDSWFAGTWDGVFRSGDLTRWTECSSGLPMGSIVALTATASGDLLAVDGRMLYRSQDGCRSWAPLLPLPPSRSPEEWTTRPILVSDSTIGIVMLGPGIAQLSLGPERKWNVRAESRDEITAWAKDDRGRYWLGTRRGLLSLTVDGTEWRLSPSGLQGDVAAVAVDADGYLLVAVAGRGIFRARLP
jgi:photosystem II stability/assembly factor-like uncharacterized protein